jgi:hypothetical protein
MAMPLAGASIYTEEYGIRDRSKPWDDSVHAGKRKGDREVETRWL